jgi:hypothetical protein
MDLIERYLAAIGPLLPGRQRADILEELREALLGRREEKATELGRPLTRDEDAALLRAFGNPLVVAGRYGSQQYLVGPEIYPLYIFALKVLIAIIAASAVITGIVHSAVGPEQPGAAVAAAFGVLWSGSISSVGVLTIVAAVMQRQRIPLRFLNEWNPNDLPKPTPVRRRRRPSRFEHLWAIIWLSLFALWWGGALPAWIPYVTTIPLKADQRLDLSRAPIWDTLFWPVLAVTLAGVAIHAWKLVRNQQDTVARAADIVRSAAMAGLAWVALRAGHWVEVSGAGVAPADLAKVEHGVDAGFEVALVVALIAAIVSAGIEAWRLARPAPPATP